MFANRLFLLCVLTAVSTAFGSAVDTTRLVHSDVPARNVHTVVADDDSHAQPLPFFYDLYTFRGPGDSTTIVSAYAVEAGRLEAKSADSGSRYRFSVTLVLVDTALRSVTGAHDTVHVDVPRPLPGEHLLYTHIELLTAPSGHTQQRVIMIDALTPGVGQLYSEYFPIPDYSGNQLMLSDIALGQPDAKDGWKRGDATLALFPTSQFPTSAFDVYYEIYNLPEGHPYTTEITIEGAGDTGAARREPVSLHFSGKSAAGPDAVLPELRRVESSLSRGSYRLTVTITDLTTGTIASQSRLFDVRGSNRGTTMVAALPYRSGYRSSNR
jgi:hypothetical protein